MGTADITAMSRRVLNLPFRRGDGEAEVSVPQFQVTLSLTADGPCSDEELETAVLAASEALITDAPGVALGPVGSVDFTTRTVEILFTTLAVSPAVLHAKVGEVLRVLERHGFEYAGSSDTRLERDEALELAH